MPFFFASNKGKKNYQLQLLFLFLFLSNFEPQFDNLRLFEALQWTKER